MRALIIHNHMSGFGSDAIFGFERMLLRPGDEGVIRMIGGGTEPANALADAEDFDLVVISGGDGTVANVLYELRNRMIPTCIFPSGTANLMFANLGNAEEPAMIAAACRRRMLAKTDLAQMRWVDDKGERHVRGFALMAGSGYDADIMRMALEDKPTMGEAAYFVAAMRNLKPTVSHFTIEVDGTVYERDGISCIVANNSSIQGGMQLVPGCVMNDGLIDVMVLEVEDATMLLRPIVAGIFDPSGESLGRPHIESFRGEVIRVTSSVPVPLEFDGELTSGTVRSYEARALSGANLLVVDRHSPYWPGRR